MLNIRTLFRQPHRYRWLRMATQILTLVALTLVPLLGIVRIDLWGGQHLFRGRSVSFGGAIVGSVIAIAVFYLITYVVNTSFGRLFCGWGCPVGQLHRFGDVAALPGRYRKVPAFAYAVLLAGAVLPWWTDLRVLTEGSWQARGVFALAWVGLVGIFLAHARWVRWTFCEKWCPVGHYYSIIRVDKAQGVAFDAALDTCIDCDVCTRVCPVDLDPRNLHKPLNDRGGIAASGLPGLNHCLACGDCVEACEHVLRKKDVQVPLLFARVASGSPAPYRPDEAATAETDASASDEA